MSRTIRFAQVGRPEVLEFIETEVPAPRLYEVRTIALIRSSDHSEFSL